jgi:hypothetical protein
VEEVGQGVSLVADCGTEIVWAIAFDVVVFDMVIIVGVPGVAHQWIGNIWEENIEP